MKSYEDWQIKYVPHGINKSKFYPIKDRGDTKFKEFEQKHGLDKYKFNKLMDKIAELEKKEDFSEIVLQTSASGKKLEDLITLRL